ncbi:MAG: diaminopropionate ammonia-lyase [Pseudomonadales bacterium]
MSRIYFSPPALQSKATPHDLRSSLGAPAAQRVRRALGACPAYAPTPVHPLPQLAREWGLRQVWAKDERSRLDLGSFKALGGTYAVLSLSQAIAARHAGTTGSIAELVRFRHPAVTVTTFAAATSGNHGRAVAAGARLVGARCVIFVKTGVPDEQVKAIRDLGAQVVTIAGTYDDAVRACDAACATHDWIAIPDFSSREDDATVALVMEGYSLLASELLDQLPRQPSHLVLQAGVGGFAAAVGGHIAAVAGRAPQVIVSEPDAAACLQSSAMAGHAIRLQHATSTIMGRLDCYAPSAPAWRVLRNIVSAWVSVTDDDALWACDRLADYDLHTTASGSAGLAALRQLMTSRGARQRLALDANSEVAIVITEAVP